MTVPRPMASGNCMKTVLPAGVTLTTRSFTGRLSGLSETEQDWVVLVWSPTSTLSSVCLLPVGNFSQRISLTREVRNDETKKNSQRRLNNNDVVIKHSQGPLVLSQGL